MMCHHQEKARAMIVVKLDLSDLYHRVNRKFGRKLNFEAVLKRLLEPGAEFSVSAYGIQRDNEASGFISCLQRLGIITHFKRPEIIRCGDREIKRANWDLGIGMDVMVDIEAEDKLTGVILGTGNNSMAPLARYLGNRSIRCLVFGCGVGRDLRSAAAGVIDITEDLLET